jgi:hypothetical protein
MNNMDRTEVYRTIMSKLMNDKIVVGCVTCNTFFLNMKWKDYLPLIINDLASPTKWYNKVAKHYCDNPTHQIMSNRNPQGFNESFDFTKAFRHQLLENNLSLTDFRITVNEIAQQVEFLPI